MPVRVFIVVYLWGGGGSMTLKMSLVSASILRAVARTLMGGGVHVLHNELH